MTTQSIITLGLAAEDYTRRWLASGEIAVATLRDGTASATSGREAGRISY